MTYDPSDLGGRKDANCKEPGDNGNTCPKASRMKISPCGNKGRNPISIQPTGRDHVALAETCIASDICFPSSDTLGRELVTLYKLTETVKL